jgi:hypothetical protein
MTQRGWLAFPAAPPVLSAACCQAARDSRGPESSGEMWVAPPLPDLLAEVLALQPALRPSTDLRRSRAAVPCPSLGTGWLRASLCAARFVTPEMPRGTLEQSSDCLSWGLSSSRPPAQTLRVHSRSPRSPAPTFARKLPHLLCRSALAVPPGFSGLLRAGPCGDVALHCRSWVHHVLSDARRDPLLT